MRFLILPDCAAGKEVLDRAPGRFGPEMITHASGRPWVVGAWAEQDVAQVSAGRRRLVLLGPARLDGAAAERTLGGAPALSGLDAIGARTPGSFHLLASMDGRTRSQGTASTSRQVFYATVAGLTVAASDPGVLAMLADARLDEEALALRLLTPTAPWPLSQRPIWTGVTELEAGCWLDIGPDGARRTARWWRPPEPHLPLAAGAALVRRALLEGVAAQARGAGAVSVDLSGGLDSTGLCFLAAASGADLLTHHWTPLDQANDDTAWARQAAAQLPRARHRFVAAGAAPAWFAPPDQSQHQGQDGRHDDVEGPTSWQRNRAHAEQLSRVDAAEGVGVHLIGLGGDELFGALPSHVWSLARQRPLASIPTVSRYRLVNRWGLLATLRGIADSTSFARSLRAAANTVANPPPGPFDVQMGWHGQPRMPAWATAAAIDAVRRQLREAAAANPSPLHPDRAQHQALEGAVLGGRAIRQLRHALGRFGVRWEAPYLDDRVIEAALSVRVADRVARGQYKPVLTGALRGVVPDSLLTRRSKGEYTAEAYDGLLRNRGRLLELCAGLRLAQLGLVDAAKLGAALLHPGLEARHLNPFDNTLACETWLRSPSALPRIALPAGGPG
jgi:asparagine synthase (glutamine-hydrolysing)